MKVIPWDGEPISKPGIYSGVPMSIYHGGGLCIGPSISSSGLRKIFDPKRGPMEYWMESPLNPLRVEPEDKEAFILGRAAHHLFLGEADFRKHFVIEPETYPDPKTGAPKPWNNNATYCRDWHEHVRENYQTALTRKQLEVIRGMAGVLPWQKGFTDSGLANNALVRPASGHGILHGLVEHTIVGLDEETGVYLLSRPDVIPIDSTEAADFKTSAAVDDKALQRTLDELRYDMQAELTARCLRQAADGLELTSFAFIFAGKKPPHAVRITEIKAADLGDAANDNRAAIRTFHHCLKTGRWPGPGGTVSDAMPINRSEWSKREAADRRAILEQELSAA